MTFLISIFGLFLWLYLGIFFFLSTKTVISQSQPQGNSINGNGRNSSIVYIDGSAAIATIDENFICATLDWWPPEKCDYGTCSWGQSSLLNLDLNNQILFNAVKAFSPLKIRIGGTLEDIVIYQTIDDGHQILPCNNFSQDTNELFGWTQGCLTLSRWDDLNHFFSMAGVEVIFGLNALYGRNVSSNGDVNEPWDSSNAESLIRYTAEQNYNIYGWELGNELSGNGIGARVDADQYTTDIIKLHNLVEDVYRGFKVKPLIMGPGGFFDDAWFSKFINQTSGSLQVVTHHIYNLGPGVDDHLVDKILDPDYLDSGSQPFKDLQTIVKNSGSLVKAWVGEAGGAYNSGRNLVTNRFVFSFWFLDQLGMTSLYDTKTYCRQTLIGGNYGLLNTTTFNPNPDYYSALLWHRLMGEKVLSTKSNAIKKLRTYAHCSKNSTGITILLVNLDSNTTVEVGLSVTNATSLNTPPWSLNTSTPSSSATSTVRFRPAIRKGGYKLNRILRREYHLTAEDGDIHSETVLLNGKILTVNTTSGEIPLLKPKLVDPSIPILVAPFSIVFVDIPSIILTPCK